MRSLSLPKEIGGHRGKHSVVDMGSLIFTGFYLYLLPAWKVLLWRPAEFAELFSFGGGSVPSFLFPVPFCATQKVSRGALRTHRSGEGARVGPRVVPRVGPRVEPRVRPRERPRQDPRGLTFPRRRPRKCPWKCPVKWSIFTCPVFICSVCQPSMLVVIDHATPCFWIPLEAARRSRGSKVPKFEGLIFWHACSLHLGCWPFPRFLQNSVEISQMIRRYYPFPFKKSTVRKLGTLEKARLTCSEKSTSLAILWGAVILSGALVLKKCQ